MLAKELQIFCKRESRWWRELFFQEKCHWHKQLALGDMLFMWAVISFAIQVRNMSSSAAPLGHVCYRIRNTCHFANEFNTKVHQICGFRMRQHSARKPEKQPPSANAGMVYPVFTSWGESKDWEREGGEKERDLGSVMIINYPFSRRQLCLRTGLLVRVWWFMLQNDYHIINRPGWILAFVVQRTLLKKTLRAWGRKDMWRSGQHGVCHQKCICRGSAHKDGN